MFNSLMNVYVHIWQNINIVNLRYYIELWWICAYICNASSRETSGRGRVHALISSSVIRQAFEIWRINRQLTGNDDLTSSHEYENSLLCRVSNVCMHVNTSENYFWLANVMIQSLVVRPTRDELAWDYSSLHTFKLLSNLISAYKC